uniref:Uncharacterized protein n=1 Tax=Rhizophora mucronata TaxID=61149 RepID=A0A2P2NB67_RHIMU
MYLHFLRRTNKSHS